MKKGLFGPKRVFLVVFGWLMKLFRRDKRSTDMVYIPSAEWTEYKGRVEQYIRASELRFKKMEGHITGQKSWSTTKEEKVEFENPEEMVVFMSNRGYSQKQIGKMTQKFMDAEGTLASLAEKFGFEDFEPTTAWVKKHWLILEPIIKGHIGKPENPSGEDAAENLIMGGLHG